MSRWSTLWACALLLLYPWANRLAVAGNLSPVDGLALAGFAAMLLNPAWLTRARTLYTRTPYGAAAFVLAVVFLASLFRTRQFGEPELGVAQLLFSWHVVIPTIAVLVSLHERPDRLVASIGVAYVALYLGGWAIAALTGSSAIVQFSGIGRVFPRFDGMVFWWMPAIAPALVALAAGEKLGRPALLALLAAALVVFAFASRALLLALVIGVAYTTVLVLRARRRRTAGLLLGATIGALLVGALLNREALVAVGLSTRYGVTDLGGDDVRGSMYLTALFQWIDRPAGFLFGLGQQFYFGDQVVHNVFLQTAVFAGVFALVALVVLFAAPALAAGSRRDAGVERTRLLLFVRVNLVMLFPWLMTHPLQYSRWYWAYYAAILGVGLRAALVEARAVPAQQATHDEPAADRPMATV